MGQAAQATGYEAGQVLYMALELSSRRWRLGFSNGRKNRQKSVEAGNRGSVLKEVSLAKEKLGLPADARVIACFEAGRDGHWIYRWLREDGIEALEIDSSSIEKPQGRKHVKTDRVDVEKLLDLLVRYCNGYRKAFRVVRVPSEEAEAGLRLHRERGRLITQRGRLRNQMRSVLVLQGIKELVLTRHFGSWLDGVRDWSGKPLSAPHKAELTRLYREYRQTQAHLREVDKEYEAELESDTRVGQQRRQLELLQGIGPQGSRIMSAEAFSWRAFRNTKEVGSVAGLTPTPSQSGEISREQGISKAGNWRLRWIMIELAWQWLRHQPDSALTQWYWSRFGHGGKRMRRIGIVALARKLLIALWKYVEHGIVPEGAVFKPAKG
jgi:transposase